MLRRIALILSILAVIAGLLIYFGSRANPVSNEPLPYWLAIVGKRVGFWLAAALTGISLIAVIVKIARRQSLPLAAVILFIIATAAACWGSVPSFFVQLYHRASYTVEQTGLSYHLALLTPLDGDYHYILYECEPSGLMCAPVYRSPVYPPGSIGDANASARLIPTIDEMSVRIVIGDQIVYVHEPGE